MTTINCTRCSTIKPEGQFYRNRALVRGRMGQCKSCIRLANSVRNQSKKDAIRGVINDGAKPKDPSLSPNSSLDQFDILKEVVVDGKLKHFTSLFVAQSESGKTILMMFLINKLKKYYDLIILVSKNIQAESYDLKKFDFYTNEVYLEKVVYAIRYLQRLTNNKFNILLIVDDIKTRQKLTIQELFTNGRNSNISIMNLVQHPTMIDNHMRCNCKFIFLFHQKNPELIAVTTKYFLLKFVKVPPELHSIFQKLAYLENWLQKNTEDYTSVVLNIKSGVIQKIKAKI